MTFIYTLSDEKNIRYVGKTKHLNKRLSSHKNESKLKRTHKEKWINNVLLNGGKIIMEILEICDDDIANETEIYWIGQFKCWGFDIVNLTFGGDGSSGMLGKKHSKKTKSLLSEKAKKRKCLVSGWNKGMKMSEKFKKNVGESLRGRIVSQETRKKISESLKGRINKPLTEGHKKKISDTKKGKVSTFKGKTHTPEAIKKMSEKKIGVKRTKNSISKQVEKQKLLWVIKSPNGDILNFFGYNSFKDYVLKNKIDVSVTTLKSYGKNKGWLVIEKIKNDKHTNN
jgi:group I intron endonuclease